MATTAMLSFALFASSSLAAPIAFVEHPSSNHRPARSIDQAPIALLGDTVVGSIAGGTNEQGGRSAGLTTPLPLADATAADKSLAGSLTIANLDVAIDERHRRTISQPLLEVTSGSSFCQTDASGCATDGVGSHGDNEACTIRVNSAGMLTATHFDTESGYDYVTIGGDRYEGSTGPSNVDVAAGSTFSWRADHSITNSGWVICFHAPMEFGKVDTQSTMPGSSNAQPIDAVPAAKFSFPITAAVIQQLDADSDAVSMRAFGYQQLAGTSWSDVCNWISPISLPTHAGSIGADAVTFWGEFEQVVDLQTIRKQSATTAYARDYLKMLPPMFVDHTVSAAADEVEKDFPTKFPTMLVEKFLGETVAFESLFDATVVPHTGNDFVNKEVMLADIIGWAVSIVSPTAFAAKWQNGRARPEEVAWAVHREDTHVAGASAMVVSKIQALGLGSPYDFTQYAKGSPKHPSWPAMHSAASSASLYLAVLLDLNPTQLAEARNLDCAVASFRTLAGVHYESDNMAGLSIGQEVIRRELPGFLQTRYGSDPDAVTAKIESVIDAHDWRNADSCFKPRASWPSL